MAENLPCLNKTSKKISKLKYSSICEYEINLRSVNPSRPNPGRTEKNELNFYFHTSLCGAIPGEEKKLS